MKMCFKIKVTDMAEESIAAAGRLSFKIVAKKTVRELRKNEDILSPSSFIVTNIRY